MKMLQFLQLNALQRQDAVKKMIRISEELKVPVAGVLGGMSIIDAINKDVNPDGDFIFNELDESTVDVIYRENS